MNYQSMALGVWLGIAVLAPIWASLTLWRVRRHLNPHRPDVGMPDGRLVSSAAAVMTNPVNSP